MKNESEDTAVPVPQKETYKGQTQVSIPSDKYEEMINADVLTINGVEFIRKKLALKLMEGYASAKIPEHQRKEAETWNKAIEAAILIVVDEFSLKPTDVNKIKDWHLVKRLEGLKK